MTKATIQNQTASQVEFSITVTAQELQSAKTAAIQEVKKDLKAPGFRPGQVPDAIAERQLDQAKLQMDVVEKVLAATFTEAVKGHKIKTLAQPKVDIKKFVPYDELEYVATVAILPDIDYDYTKLRVKYDEPKVTDEEINQALQNLQEQFAERKAVDRAAKQGDELRIDFVGKKDGEAVEGAAAQNSMIVLGSGRLIPGFEDELIGMKKGDNKTFDITFPEDYHAPELAGQKVTFTIDVHEVREVEEVKLDDTFAKKVANMPKLADLKEDIRVNLQEGKAKDARQGYESAVLEETIKHTKLEISPILEEEQIQDLRNEYAEKVKSQGLELEAWLKVQKKTEDEFTAELTEEARRRIGVGLIIRDIIEKQKLTVEIEEVNEQLERMRTSYTDPEVIKHLDHDHFKNDLANRLVTQKAVDWLTEQAKGPAKKTS